MVNVIMWVSVLVGTVLLDQISKLLVVTYLQGEEPFVLLDGVLRFTYVENRGAAFGMLSEHRWVFLVISVVAIVALLIYLVKWPPDSKWACAALAMIAGGGVGNMIDRVFRVGEDGVGYVVDFIDFYFWPDVWKWTFNVADSFVCIGAGILLLWCVISLFADCRQKKKPQPTASDAPDTQSEESQEK